VLPANNHEHGIYVESATDTRVEWNLIYDNADRGIQLYPNAQYTTIDHNVIDDNGEGIIFSGDNGVASDHADVYNNLLTNSQIRHDAESYYPAGNPTGTGNVLHDNCLWGGREGTIDSSGGGFTAANNKVADPQYIAPAEHNYHLLPTSPCLQLVGDIAAAVDGTPPTQPTGTNGGTNTSGTPTAPGGGTNKAGGSTSGTLITTVHPPARTGPPRRAHRPTVRAHAAARRASAGARSRHHGSRKHRKRRRTTRR
jgi:parallel beta-helix repeat protein